MAGNRNLSSLPEGVSILKSNNDDKTYVVNEVLNYYQRKMRVVGAGPVKKYSHHIFKPNKLDEARQILQKLWAWRNLEPIPTHMDAVNKLITPRTMRGTNQRLALDIIEFLEKEDARLDVIFLTLCCEEIPSKIHERDALQEVYLLLEKNEFEYTQVIENLHAKEFAINAHTKMLNDMKNDMYSHGHGSLRQCFLESGPQYLQNYTN